MDHHAVGNTLTTQPAQNRRAALTLTRTAIHRGQIDDLAEVLRSVGLAPGSEPHDTHQNEYGVRHSARHRHPRNRAGAE